VTAPLRPEYRMHFEPMNQVLLDTIERPCYDIAHTLERG
jgi:hypothetical protein